MSSAWSQFEITNKPVGLHPDTAYKYGIDFEWGALHVTEQADRSYGFCPLAKTVEQDRIDSSGAAMFGMRADVYLMSPQEFADWDKGDDIRPVSLSGKPRGLGGVTLHKGGIELRMALSHGTEGFKERLLGKIASFAEQFDEPIENVVTADDIPVTEAIERDTSQLLIHGVSGFAGEMAQEAATEFLVMNTNKQALRSCTWIGGAGLLAAGLVVGVNGLVNREIDTFSAATALFYVGSTGCWSL